MTEGHLCFLFCWLFTVFPFFLPCFFKRRDFSVMNSGPVLYLIYLIFCNKKKRKRFLLLLKYICIWWYWGEGTLATNWDVVVRNKVFELLSDLRPIVSLRSKLIRLNGRWGNHSWLLTWTRCCFALESRIWSHCDLTTQDVHFDYFVYIIEKEYYFCMRHEGECVCERNGPKSNWKSELGSNTICSCRFSEIFWGTCRVCLYRRERQEGDIRAS